ncbi:hypothetical protein [Cerasicoccus fimbriatus]|uniref:hypothetical protein n=1 Tax=Cerasicoccus fimbriatus TaxID=3014554 RepID=UPI0022B411E8|nr:hypothetical protein [Cerasicoccus sp. TK19100]
MKALNKSTVNVSITLPPSLHLAARQAASEDQRSLSGLIASLLKDHLCAEGYVSPTLERLERPYSRRRA